MKYAVTLNDKTYLIEINDDQHVIVDGVEYSVNFESVSGQPVYSLLLDGHSYEAYIYEADDDLHVLLQGDLYTVRVEDEREKRLRAAASSLGGAASGEFTLKAPMPGLIVAIPVTEGQPIKKGELVVILESMKMQNELKSPRDGTVKRVKVKAGDSVEQNQSLVTIA
jgi:biotin carboxyl carrier protein